MPHAYHSACVAPEPAIGTCAKGRLKSGTAELNAWYHVNFILINNSAAVQALSPVLNCLWESLLKLAPCCEVAHNTTVHVRGPKLPVFAFHYYRRERPIEPSELYNLPCNFPWVSWVPNSMFRRRSVRTMRTRIFTLLLIVGCFMIPVSRSHGADRTKCCHGCGSYYCNEKNCGSQCQSGPHCSGCWKGC